MERAEAGEQLIDLEIMCLVMWRGIDKMIYENANKEQRKVLKIMEERINHLYQNPMELTRAEEAWFYQRDLIERERLGREEGIAEGIAKGKAEGMVKAYVQCIVSF